MPLLAAVLFLLQAGALQPQKAFEQAGQALASHDYLEAERGFLQVLKTAPNHVGALGNLGVVYSRTNRFNDAIRVYSRALKLAPDEPGLLLNLGLVYLKRDDHAHALPLFETLAKRTSPKPTSQVRELLATARLYTGDIDAAIAGLRELRNEESYNSGALYLLAVAHLRQKDRQAAAAMFDELLRVLKPAPAHYLTGKAYFENGLLEEAVTEFRNAASIDPSLPGVQLELGKTYTSMRNFEEAEKCFRAVLHLSPDDPDAAYYLGALLTQGERIASGIQILERVLTRNPDSWGAAFYLGKAKLQQGKSTEAVTLLKRAAELNPDQPAVWMQLSRAAKQAGRPAESREALRRFELLRKLAPAQPSSEPLEPAVIR